MAVIIVFLVLGFLTLTHWLVWCIGRRSGLDRADEDTFEAGRMLGASEERNRHGR